MDGAISTRLRRALLLGAAVASVASYAGAQAQRRGARPAAAAPPTSKEEERALLEVLESGARDDAQAAANELHLDYDGWMAGCLREAASLRPELERAARGAPAWVIDGKALLGTCQAVLRRKTDVAPPRRRSAVRAALLSNIEMVAHPTVLGPRGEVSGGQPARRPGVDRSSWIAGCQADLTARIEEGRRAGFTYGVPSGFCDRMLSEAGDVAPQARRRAIDAKLSAVEAKFVRSQATEEAAAAEAAVQAQARRLRVDYGQWIAGCQADVAERVEKGRRKGYDYALSPTTVTAVCRRLLGEVADGGVGARRRAVWAHLDGLEKASPSW